MKDSDASTSANGGSVRIFSVVTRFQTLAVRPGGIPREKAIAQANATLAELKPELDGWIDEEITALRRSLPRADEHRADSDWVAAATKHAGHLRDVGSTAGYELVTFVAGAMCEILESGEAATVRGVDSLNCHFDALQLVRRPEYYRLRAADLPELKTGLLRLVARIAPRAGDES